MANFNECADTLVCSTLSGSNGIGISLELGTPNKIVVSASNIPNSALQNSSININGTTIALGATGSLAIGDITAVTAGTNLTGGGTSGSVTVSLTSSITSGLTNISNLTSLGAQYIDLSRSAGIAFIEMGGPTGAHIDLKNPFSDDYDLRIKSWGTEGGGEIRNSDGASIVLSGTNVGIGTTTPNYKLEVNGTISGSAVYGLSGSSAQFPNFTSDVRKQISGAGSISYDNSTGIISYTGGGGTVTSVTAGTNLSASGTSTAPILNLTSSITGGLTNISGTTTITSVSGNFTRLTGSNISGTNNLLVGGNVGIGTSTPGDKLDINGGLTVRGSRIYQSSSGYQAEFGPGAGIGTPSENYGIYAPTGKRLVLNTGDGSRIFLSGTNVGIGVSDPTSHKLQVDGTISGSAVYGLSGSSAQFPNFTTDVRNQFSQGTGITISSGEIINNDRGSSQNIFKTFNGDTGNTTANSNTDTLTIAGGDGLSTTGSSATDTITINVDDTVVRTSGNQTIAGTKTFTSTIAGSINGNAATVTNGVYTNSTNVVTNTMLRQSAATSVIGRSANSVGNVADISTTTDNHVLRRSGGILGFGTLANQSLQNSSITINSVAVSLGSSTNVGTITEIVAGQGLSGGGTAGQATIDIVGATGGGIQVNTDSIQVDSTVVRTTGDQSVAGIKTFSNEIVNTVNANAIIPYKWSLTARNIPRAWAKYVLYYDDPTLSYIYNVVSNNTGYNIWNRDTLHPSYIDIGSGEIGFAVWDRFGSYANTANLYGSAQVTIEDPSRLLDAGYPCVCYQIGTAYVSAQQMTIFKFLVRSTVNNTGDGIDLREYIGGNITKKLYFNFCLFGYPVDVPT